jgi:tripartite-type tricarboxylate transporter receptor subunit TctC
MTRHFARTVPLSLAAIGLSLTATAAFAADDFYKGKNLTIIASGQGLYEDYGRIVGKHLVKFIPGNPNPVVQVMTGASGLTAANYIYNNAPKDGSVIVVTHGQIPTTPLLNPEGVRYDPVKFSWLGSATKDIFVGYCWATAPAKSMEEAKIIELKVGGQAPGSMSIDMGILAKELFGLKFKIITGYSGSNETKMAVEKGEIDCHFGNAWTSIKNSNPEWLAQKKINIIAQFGYKRHRELQDVPLFIDLATKPEDRQVVDLFLARQETAKPFYGPPGIPQDRLDILRAAFDKTMKDPDYLAEMKKLKLETEEPMSWQEALNVVSNLQKTPKSTVDRMYAIFEKFRQGKLN